MLKEKLDQSMEEFKLGKITYMKLRDKIITATYKNYNLFRKSFPELDEFHDFLLYFIPQIKNIVEKYQRELSRFSTFYFAYIHTAIKRWKYMKKFKEIKDDISEVGEENLLIDTIENYSKNEAENQLEKFYENSKPAEKCTIKDLLNDQRKENSERNNNGLIKRAILIAGLKLSYYMSDARIKAISDFTGVSQEELFEKKEKVNIQLEHKISKVEKRMESLQKSYSNHKKFMMENILVENDNWAQVTKSNNPGPQSRWQKITKELATDSTLCVKASNRTIAEILETNEKKIAYALECASKLLKEFEADSKSNHIEHNEHLEYSSNYENLFGNRKRKQKKGNAGNAPTASDCNS